MKFELPERGSRLRGGTVCIRLLFARILLGAEGDGVAESFLCSGEWVHLSNGGAVTLFQGWERLARAAAGQPGMAALAGYLRQTLDGSGVGCMAFGMDREELPVELAGPDEVAALLSVAEQTAADPMLIPDVAWSPEVLDWWRGKLARLLQALRQSAGGHEPS